MRAHVLHIHTAPATGQGMQAHERVELRADFGIVGDRCAEQGSLGQVTLVSADQLTRAEAKLGSPIPPGSTRRNITIEGLELASQVGLRIRLGAVLVEISEDADPCGLMDKVIAEGARAALAGLSGVCARVIEGGDLQIGDPVSVVDERAS